MLINGEKWACEACVRGHRVSNCQHSDRPLQHINKKGRPVSQCQHCRAMRKSRASHVKCDCGEKTHKCQHLQPTVEGHKESCCCNHGGRCTCSCKKEPVLDPVPESESENELPSIKSKTIRRRRANTALSEPVLSFDENGHHKPTHKHSKLSAKCGPYTLNRGNSLHSTGSLGKNRSVDNLLHHKAGSSRVKQSSISSSEDLQRRVKSEQASPAIGSNSTFQQLNGSLPPLDLSSIEYPSYVQSFDMFSGMSDHEQPMFSAGLSAASVDWAQYDGLELNGDSFAPSSFGQPPSYNGLDFATSTEPTLTSNSGDVSESEDLVPAFSESDFDNFQNSTAASSYMNLAQNQGTTLAGADVSNFDYDQFKGTASKFLPSPNSMEDNVVGFPTMEEDPFWMSTNFNDGITQSPDPVSTVFWADGLS